MQRFDRRRVGELGWSREVLVPQVALLLLRILPIHRHFVVVLRHCPCNSFYRVRSHRRVLDSLSTFRARISRLLDLVVLPPQLFFDLHPMLWCVRLAEVFEVMFKGGRMRRVFRIKFHMFAKARVEPVHDAFLTEGVSTFQSKWEGYGR